MKSRADVMTSEQCAYGTLHLRLLPPKVWRDARYQGGSCGPAHRFYLERRPSVRPVWWILSLALLSWVIWGIIPKVSPPNSSVVGDCFVPAAAPTAKLF